MTFKKDFKQQMVPEWEKEYMDYEGLKRILKEMKSRKQTKHNRSLQHRLKLERAFSGLHLQGSNHQREEDNEEQVIEVKTLEEEDGSKQLYKTNFHKLNEEGGEAEARLFQKLDEELNKVNAFYKDQVEAANHESNLLSKQVEALVALRVKVKSPDAGNENSSSSSMQLKQIVSSPKETADQNHQQKDSMIGPEVDPVQQTNRNIHHHEEQAETHNNYNRRDPLEILEHVKLDDSLQCPKSTIKKAFTDSSDNELSISKEELKKIDKQLRLVFVEFYQKLLHLKDYRAASTAYMKVVDNSYLGSSDEVGLNHNLFGYITLHMLVYAANTYYWKRYRVNYPFLFGFRAGTELDYREIFLLTSGHAVIEMNSRSQQYKTATELVPLILVVLVLLITFCPLNIIYRSSRFFFIRCLFRCICAPVFKVRLADFFLADQLTSQFQAFKSVELYICYYGLGEHSRRQKKCHTHGIYNIQYFIVGIIPYWFRLAQCMRQFYEEGDINRAFNSLNYLSTITAMVFRTAFELKKGRSWKVLALVTSALAVLQNTYWDIVKDWGLLQRLSKNPYLRDKLILPHRSIYFIAMFVDIALRISWMQLVFEMNWSPLRKVTIITVTSCLEIVRRGIWNFFRLENEHLNNVGNYRAFKSVPHPFSYYDEEKNKDE
ncbi:hypothetical protein V8G54_014673 [Vigna mungo]|uniref:Uncharacterized protein n=1 Tax=Vigna mungo TaxID=3915 RepID=A0AAQ3RYS7_VIGMU